MRHDTRTFIDVQTSFDIDGLGSLDIMSYSIALGTHFSRMFSIEMGVPRWDLGDCG